MHKTLAIMEPLGKIQNIPFGKYVEYIKDLRTNISIVPALKTARQSSQLFLFSTEYSYADYIATRVDAEHIIPELSYHQEKEISLASRTLSNKAVSILKKWIPKESDYIQAVTQHIITEIYILIHNLSWIENLTENINPDEVLIESRNFNLGKITWEVCKRDGIRCKEIASSLGGLKERIKNHISQRIYFEAELVTKRMQLFNKKGDGKTILVDARYSNSLKGILPVLEKLDRKDIFVLTAKENEKYLDSFFKVSPKIKSPMDGTTFRKFTAVDVRNIIYKKIPLADFIKPKLQYLAARGYSKTIKDASHMKSLLEYLKPAMIITGDDRVVSTRSHILLAKHMGIKSLEIPHGFYNDINPLTSVTSDKIAVGGKTIKNIMMSFGTESRNIEITGWPKFDPTIKKGTQTSEKYILFATQPMDYRTNLEIARILSRNLKRQELIIKPHPGENEKVYKEITKNATLVPKNSDFVSLLKDCEVLVTIGSTAVLEAIALRKPVFLIDVFGDTTAKYYLRNRIAIRVKNLEELGTMIKNRGLLKKKIREADIRRFLHSHLYKLDGMASRRIAYLIDRMVQ